MKHVECINCTRHVHWHVMQLNDVVERKCLKTKWCHWLRNVENETQGKKKRWADDDNVGLKDFRNEILWTVSNSCWAVWLFVIANAPSDLYDTQNADTQLHSTSCVCVAASNPLGSFWSLGNYKVFEMDSAAMANKQWQFVYFLSSALPSSEYDVCWTECEY